MIKTKFTNLIYTETIPRFKLFSFKKYFLLWLR